MRETAEERFWAQVEKTEMCWLWLGTKNTGGYGSIWVHGHHVFAHRFAYELLVGPIPEGLEPDHLCRNHSCVNPAHLEPVPHGENVRRGTGGRDARERQLRKTHCPQGHPYDLFNTYYAPNGERACRACKAVNKRNSRLRINAQAAAFVVSVFVLLWLP